MNVKEMHDQTFRELVRVIDQRKELDKKAAALRTALNGFKALLEAEQEKYQIARVAPPLPPGYDGLREMGLTNAIRKLFENEPDYLTPKDVRDKLGSMEYKKLPRSNALAAIHGIFTRLEKAGEIAPITSELAKTLGVKNAYQWINPAERAADGMYGLSALSGNEPLKRPKFYGR